MADATALSTGSPTDAFFDSYGPYESLGLTPAIPANALHANAIPGLARATGPGGAMQERAPLYSPDNPLFWLGGLLAVTLGLVAFSTHFGVRVGKQRARIGLDIGKGA